MSNPKLTDVAQLAAVSPATVSRAINQPAIVNAKTLERIQQAIQQIGYETNTAGRNLRLRRSDALLVMISDAPSRFFSQILMGVEAEASENGYNVLVSNTQENPERGRRLYASIQQSLADGILTFGGHNQELGDLIRNHPIPIVGVNERLEDLPVPVTTVDNLSTSREIVRHLLKLGHRKIGHVTGTTILASGRDRLEGFSSELQQEGLIPTWICNKHYNVESGREAAEEWLRLTDRPTAVFCSCDEAAFGFIAALRRKKIRVPEDVSVVGFDDIPLADHYCPALTTVRQPHRELGTTAVRMLLERIHDVEASIPNQLLEGKLIVRESTGHPPIT